MAQFLHFSTTTQSFLLPLANVRKIISWTTPRMLPLVPDYIRGVIHYEGTIWVVVDLGVILGQAGEDNCGEMVLVKQDEYHLALKIHRTREIVSLEPAATEKTAHSSLPGRCVDFLAVVGGEMCHCLNLREFIQEFSVK